MKGPAFSNKKVHLSVTLSPEILSSSRKAAFQDNRSLSAFVEIALRKYLDSYWKKEPPSRNPEEKLPPYQAAPKKSQ